MVTGSTYNNKQMRHEYISVDYYTQNFNNEIKTTYMYEYEKLKKYIMQFARQSGKTSYKLKILGDLINDLYLYNEKEGKVVKYDII